MTFFNYITGITIGSIAANIISESNRPFTDEFVGLIWLCFLTDFLGRIGLKSGHLRRIIDGQPTILIKKGKLDRNAIKKTRINMDDLSMMLREQNAYSVTDVEYAILEPDGKISVMKKSGKEQVTKDDMKLPLPDYRQMPAEIIVDGKIIKHNLHEFNKDENWLMSQLKQQNIATIKDVFYSELQEDGTLYIEKF